MSQTSWDAVNSAYEAVRKKYPDGVRPTIPPLTQLLDRPAVRQLQYNEDQVVKTRFSLPSQPALAHRHLKAALLQVSDQQGSQDPAACAPAPFEISHCTDGTMGWKMKPGQRCVRLYYGADMKSVSTMDDAIDISINAAEISNFVRKDAEENSSAGIVKIFYKDVTRSPVTLVFDRSKGSTIDLGRKQARRYIAWLRGCDVRPCPDKDAAD
ncbi:hypothetical protein SLS62_002067 [Diatrype stigma]|uniref:Uncharacterized protein n=1 Tax=Diatrype stigma TaxID=117547 RepID=A0AAN9UZ44_9PEZI